jgi:Cu/Ag efflux protein CusF
MLFKIIVVLLFVVTVACGAAQESRAQDSQVMTGEVINVDFHSGMITIRHSSNGPLGLGQSTDQFRAAEPIMLNALRPGAKVKFAAMRTGNDLSITKILTE